MCRRRGGRGRRRAARGRGRWRGRRGATRLRLLCCACARRCPRVCMAPAGPSRVGRSERLVRADVRARAAGLRLAVRRPAAEAPERAPARARARWPAAPAANMLGAAAAGWESRVGAAAPCGRRLRTRRGAGASRGARPRARPSPPGTRRAAAGRGCCRAPSVTTLSSSTRAAASSPPSRSTRPRVSRRDGWSHFSSPSRQIRIASTKSPSLRRSSATCAYFRGLGSASSFRRSSSYRASGAGSGGSAFEAGGS